MRKSTNTDISLERIALTLGATLLLSFFVFFMYRATVRDVPYSKGFAVSMAMVSVVTAGIILAVQSSIIISLGMVGALSIVRFRTAIKNPMDLLFLFWSISLGIITGAGLYALSAGTCIIVALGLTIYQVLPVKRAPHLLVARLLGDQADDRLMEMLGKQFRGFKVKSRSIAGETTELVIEIRAVKNDSQLVRSVREIEGVDAVTLLAHDGEAVSQG